MIERDKDQTGQTGQGAFLGTQPDLKKDSNKDFEATDNEEGVAFEGEKSGKPLTSLGGDEGSGSAKGNKVGNYPKKQAGDKENHSEFIEESNHESKSGSRTGNLGKTKQGPLGPTKKETD